MVSLALTNICLHGFYTYCTNTELLCKGMDLDIGSKWIFWMDGCLSNMPERVPREMEFSIGTQKTSVTRQVLSLSLYPSPHREGIGYSLVSDTYLQCYTRIISDWRNIDDAKTVSSDPLPKSRWVNTSSYKNAPLSKLFRPISASWEVFLCTIWDGLRNQLVCYSCKCM